MQYTYISLTMVEVNLPNVVHNSFRGEKEAFTRDLTRKAVKVICVCVKHFMLHGNICSFQLPMFSVLWYHNIYCLYFYLLFGKRFLYKFIRHIFFFNFIYLYIFDLYRLLKILLMYHLRTNDI